MVAKNGIPDAEDVLAAYGCIQDNDDIDKQDAISAMKEYGRALIDYILTKPDMIYIDEDEGGDVYTRMPEAVYNYEKFDLLKKEIQ